MKQPADLETQIADYLAREFGEDGPGRIRAEDLRALGEHVIDGVPMRVWGFPTSRGEMWATVEPMRDSYSIGMTHPRPSADSRQRYHLRLETEGNEAPRIVVLEPLDIGLYGTASDVGFVAPDGQTLLLSAEVALVDGGEELSLAILAEDERRMRWYWVCGRAFPARLRGRDASSTSGAATDDPGLGWPRPACSPSQRRPLPA